ncbi:MAG: AmmeMemoRadiSam system protein A [Bacillota bacterium]|jgi:AmmeMemoRadiSam system protein A
MSIVLGIISPHPPIIIPEVGKEEVKKVSETINALAKAAEMICDFDPEVVIFITPHGIVFQDAIAITVEPNLHGDFTQFGAGQVNLSCNNDLRLAEEIISTASLHNITVVPLDRHLAGKYGVKVDLDHGITVPLYYLKKQGLSCPIVPISISFFSYEDLFRFGTLIQKAVGNLGRRAVIVASGDLSHCLTLNAPAGFHPEGKEFDLTLVNLLKKGDIKGIFQLDKNLIENAGECGLRSIIMMLGAFDGYEKKTDILSYEGPFGVGYLVADVSPGEFSPEKTLVEELYRIRREAVQKIRSQESEPVALARRTLETYVQKGEIGDPPSDLSELFSKQAGVFVSIKKHGQLRGCIGTILPVQSNVAKEIMENAISAGTRDPRFEPVGPEELDDLIYSVDILSPPEPISGIKQLDPHKYGVIVKHGNKSGLLLPNLEGIDSPQEQVDIAMRKAGIRQGEPVEMERFEVVRYY